MSKLREEERKKRKFHEESEKLDVLAEGTVNQARQLLESEQKQSDKKRAKVLDFLQSQPRKIKTYNDLLASLLLKRIYLTVDWPKGWYYQAAPTEKGIVFEMKSPDNRIFRNAFKPTGLPQYDLNAIDMYCVRAQNTIDRIEKEKHGQGRTHPKNHRA